MELLIAFVAGLLLGSASLAWMFRRVFKQSSKSIMEYENKLRLQKEELNLRKIAIQGIIYETNHYWENPLYKRFRGLWGTTPETRKEIRENLDLARKPHHHRYVDIAIRYYNELEKVMEMQMLVVKELETGVLKRAEKLDDLQ